MQEFVTYWLKAAIVLAVFYLFFKILMWRESYHRLNRVVLLATALLSFVLPLCVITIERTVIMDSWPIARSSDVATAVVGQQLERGAQFDWWGIALVVMALGCGAVVAWSVNSIVSIHRLMGACREVENSPEGRVLVYDGDIAPFSWFGNIVLSQRDWIECNAMILTHERAHIALHHSADMLLVNLCCALQWFNPAMWLLGRDLREIHEYEADDAVLSSGVNAKEYQLLLIKKAVGNKSYSIANSLNHSTLKNRITMMLKKKSTRASRMRVLYVLPLVCLSLTAFAKTETIVQFDDKVTENISEKQTPTITLKGEKIIFNGKEVGVDNLASALQEAGVSPQAVINITTEGEVKMELVATLKRSLRAANYLRINYDKAVPRILPAAPENVGSKVELTQPFILSRCVMHVAVDKDNALIISYGGKEWRLHYDENKIRYGVKTFITNTHNSPSLPTKHPTEFTLPDGRPWSYDVSDGVIFLSADPNADAALFIKTSRAIWLAYEELREEVAVELFGRSVEKLTPEEREVIYRAVPVRVSETQ